MKSFYTKTNIEMSAESSNEFIEKFEKLFKEKALTFFRELGFEVYTLLQIQNLVKLEHYKEFASDLERLEEEAKEEIIS